MSSARSTAAVSRRRRMRGSRRIRALGQSLPALLLAVSLGQTGALAQETRALGAGDLVFSDAPADLLPGGEDSTSRLLQESENPSARFFEENTALDFTETQGAALARLPRIGSLQQSLQPESGDWRRQADFSFDLPDSSPLRLGITGQFFDTRSPLVLRKPSLDIGPVEDWEENQVTDLGMELGLFGDRLGYKMGIARSETAIFGDRQEEEDDDPLNLREDEDDDEDSGAEGAGQAQWHRLDLSLIEGEDVGVSSYAFYSSVDPNFYSLQDQVDQAFAKKGETWKLGGAVSLGPVELSSFWDEYALTEDDDLETQRRRGAKLDLDWFAVSGYALDSREVDFDQDDGDRETEVMRELGGEVDFGLVALELSRREVSTDYVYAETPGLWRIDERSFETGLSFDLDDYRWGEDGGFTLWGLLPSSLSLSRRQGDFALSWAPDSPLDTETRYAFDLYWDWWGKGDTSFSYETSIYDSNELGQETADERDHIVDLSQSVYGRSWDARLSLNYSDYRYRLIGERSFDSSLGGEITVKWRPENLPDIGLGLDIDALTSRSADLGYDTQELSWSFDASFDFSKYLAEYFHPAQNAHLRLTYHYETQALEDGIKNSNDLDWGHAATLNMGFRF